MWFYLGHTQEIEKTLTKTHAFLISEYEAGIGKTQILFPFNLNFSFNSFQEFKNKIQDSFAGLYHTLLALRVLRLCFCFLLGMLTVLGTIMEDGGDDNGDDGDVNGWCSWW